MADDRRHPTQLLSQVDQGVVGVVQDLFRTAVRRIRMRLVNRSSVDIPVRFGTSDLCRLGQALDRMQAQEGGAFIRFHLMPGELPGLLVIEGPLLFRLVGLLLGEDPWGEPPLYRWRALTNVDLRIAERIADDVLGGIVEACPAHLNAWTKVDHISANPRLSFPMDRSTTLVEAGLDFGPPDDPYGLMTVILPSELAAILAPQKLRRRRPENHVKKGLDRVMPIPLELTAELARVQLPLSEVKALKVGTVIPLGPITEAIIKVAGQAILRGEAGDKDGVRAVKINGRIERDDKKPVPQD